MKIKNKNYTKKNQKGGKKLGEGAFGCVVSPPLQCKKTLKTIKNVNSTDYVSKLISIKNKYDVEEITHELKMNKKLYDLDKNNFYFTTIIDGCVLKNVDKKRKDIKFVNKKEKSDKEKCLILKKKKNMNLIMKNAGLNLDDILLYEKKYIKERELIKKNYINIFYHLLKGLKKIHNAELTHHDIKPDNFAVNVNNNDLHVTYLDFGIMEENKMYSENNYANFSRSVYGTPGFISPDMYVLCKIIKYLDIYDFEFMMEPNNVSKFCKKILKEINYNEINYHKTLNLNMITLDYPIKKISQSMINYNNYNIINEDVIEKIYLNIIINIKNKSFKDLFIKTNGISHKYDIYALGITFFNVLQILNIYNKQAIDLVRSMTEPFPMKRYNINDCLNHSLFRKSKTIKKKTLRKKNTLRKKTTLRKKNN